MPKIKITTKNGFCKVAMEFVQLDGGLKTKRFAIYGRDARSLYYCENLPQNYDGNNPTLEVYRLLQSRWVKSTECNGTTKIIWTLFLRNNKQEPISYDELNCRKNQKITPCQVVYGKHQSVWKGSKADIANWQEENKAITETVDCGKRFEYIAICDGKKVRIVCRKELPLNKYTKIGEKYYKALKEVVAPIQDLSLVSTDVKIPNKKLTVKDIEKLRELVRMGRIAKVVYTEKFCYCTMSANARKLYNAAI